MTVAGDEKEGESATCSNTADALRLTCPAHTSKQNNHLKCDKIRDGILCGYVSCVKMLWKKCGRECIYEKFTFNSNQFI